MRATSNTLGRYALPGAALAVTLAGSVFVHRYNPEHWPQLAIDLMHTLHGSGFALLALAIFVVLRFRQRSPGNYRLAAAIAMGIGVLSEISQIPGPRNAEFGDLLVDALGILGTLGIVAAFDRSVRIQLTRPMRMLLPLAASIALGIACLPSLWYSFALVEQYRTFPELLTFEHRWENAIFGQTRSHLPALVARPTDWPADGDTVALATENGRWGIFLSVHPQPDWRDYSALSFVAASYKGEVGMDISLRDMPQDGERAGVRYNKFVRLDEKPQRVVVSFDEIRANPKGRPFDLSLVDAIILSASKPGQESKVLLDDFRLER
jgi:VanZ family protein